MKWGSPQHEAYKRLRKFRDADGKKMSMDSLGTIDRHQDMRLSYVSDYGVKSILRLYGEWDMFYGEIRRQAAKKAYWAEEEDRWAREAQERKDRRKGSAARIAEERERAAKEAAAHAIQEACNDLERHESKIDFWDARIEELNASIVRGEARVAQLNDDYLADLEGTRWHAVQLKNRTRRATDLMAYRSKLDQANRGLADVQARAAACRDMLDERKKETDNGG